MKLQNKKEGKILSLADNTFDCLFLIIAVITVLFAISNLIFFGKELIFHGFKMNLLFESGLTTLISVKFYKVMKDYVGAHKIELKSLIEICLVAFLSELIFKIESYSLEEILVRGGLLVVFIVFYYLETKAFK